MDFGAAVTSTVRGLMLASYRREIALAAAWLVFPLIPVFLEDLYYQICNLADSPRLGPDPHEWDWRLWVIMVGPLAGFSFLAGATQDLPDDPQSSRRGLRRLFARRAVWVAVGPWVGLLFLLGCYFAFTTLESLIPTRQSPSSAVPASETWAGTILGWGFVAAVGGILPYGWLWPAWAAMRRAARVRRARRALDRGLVAAVAFLGSLFGGFWAITSVFRSYFFDSRVVPLIALLVGLAALGGCASPMTYGQLRRRELFHAMLLAWVFGLALMWRWWSRPRRGPPQN
jgi:hypothetical protein